MRDSVNQLIEASELILDYIKSGDQNLFPLLQQLRDAIADFKDESVPRPVLLHEEEVTNLLKLYKYEGKSPAADLAHTALYYIQLSARLLSSTNQALRTIKDAEEKNPNKPTKQNV